MKNSTKKFNLGPIVILLFILAPTISIPFILIEIYNKKKYPLLLLAIYMGLLSMFYYPWGDQYRYLNYIETYRHLNFNELFDFSKVLIFRDLNCVNLFLFIAAKSGFSLELFRFSLVVISYILIFDIFNDFDKDSNSIIISYNKRFIIFLYLYLSVPFYHICYGFRTGLAICLFAYGVYKLETNKQNGYAFILLSCLTHYFFLAESIIYLISTKLRRNISKRNIVMIGGILIVILFFTLNYIYGKNAFIDIIIDTYINGEHGIESNKSIKDIFSTLLLNGILVIALYVIFLTYNYNNRLSNLLYLNLCILIISIPLPTINERFLAISVILIILYFYITNKHILINKRIILLPLLIISLIYPYWKHRDIYALTKIEEIIYKPLPLIIQHQVDIDEVNKYINSDGEYIK